MFYSFWQCLTISKKWKRGLQKISSKSIETVEKPPTKLLTKSYRKIEFSTFITVCQSFLVVNSFFYASRSISHVISIVSGCDGGNRTRNIALIPDVLSHWATMLHRCILYLNLRYIYIHFCIGFLHFLKSKSLHPNLQYMSWTRIIYFVVYITFCRSMF